MFGLFRKKTGAEQGEVVQGQPAPLVEPQQPVRYARGTRIPYDDGLVDKFKDDHRHLLKLYTEINEAAENRRFRALEERLDRFRADLTDHLLNENVKMYVFLDRSMEDDEINSELIHNYRREMDQIGKVVMEFLRRYQLHGVNSGNVEDFSMEFARIGEILGDRIAREESTLYVMYEQA